MILDGSNIRERDAAVLSRVDPNVGALVSEAVLQRHQGEANALTILVPPALPPLNGVRKDGAITSCIASGPWLDSLDHRKCGDEGLCFQLLHLALSGDIEVPEIHIINGVARGEGSKPRTVEFIIPHRGAAKHLDVCLAGVRAQSVECTASVCLDENSGWRPGLPDTDRVLAFRAIEPPIGPYAIRQFLAMRSRAEFIAFQDSDDFSVASRLSELVAAAQATGADIVGCHELRLDELKRSVIAVRFPMDVNAALEVSGRHAQFFPTTLAKTSTLRRNGGFSTTRKFGGDTEYLLRSHFFARIVNIDRFLYIRRRRSGSLTTAPETALGSPPRVELSHVWTRDFELVKKGELRLDDSSLALRNGPATQIVPADED